MTTAATHTRCPICQKPIKSGGVFLEYNRRTNTWHEPGTVPAADSQGGFIVGTACARAALAKAAKAFGMSP